MAYDLPSLFQGVGSMVGFVTGLYVLREHLTKGRPTATIALRKVRGAYGNEVTVASVHVVNRSSHPIVLSLNSNAPEHALKVLEERKVLSIMAAATGWLTLVPLSAGEARHFDIWDVDDFEKLRLDKSSRNIGPKIRWKYAQNPIVGHRLWRSFRISVTAEMYRVLINKHRSQGGDDEGTASP